MKRLVNPVAARTDPLVLKCFYQHDFTSFEPEDFEQYAVLANGLVHPEPPCLYVYILAQQHSYHNVVAIATKKIARIFHELPSRERGDGRATGQPQGV